MEENNIILPHLPSPEVRERHKENRKRNASQLLYDKKLHHVAQRSNLNFSKVFSHSIHSFLDVIHPYRLTNVCLFRDLGAAVSYKWLLLHIYAEFYVLSALLASILFELGRILTASQALQVVKLTILASVMDPVLLLSQKFDCLGSLEQCFIFLFRRFCYYYFSFWHVSIIRFEN